MATVGLVVLVVLTSTVAAMTSVKQYRSRTGAVEVWERQVAPLAVVVFSELDIELTALPDCTTSGDEVTCSGGEDYSADTVWLIRETFVTRLDYMLLAVDDAFTEIAPPESQRGRNQQRRDLVVTRPRAIVASIQRAAEDRDGPSFLLHVDELRALTADTVLWAYLAEVDLNVIDPPTSPTETPAASP